MASQFSEIKIWPAKEGLGKLRANGEVLISGTVRVKFQVIEGKDGVFASLPRVRGKDTPEGEARYYQQVLIPDKELYNEFQALVQKAYIETKGGSSTDTKPATYTDNAPF